MEDLTSFAVGVFRAFFGGSATPHQQPFPQLHARAPLSEIPTKTETHKARAITSSREQTIVPESAKSIQKSTVMYTSSLATPLRSAPDTVGDTIYTVLPYGSMVMVLDARDMWAYVASGVHTGWVYVDDLEDRAAHVYPAFHTGEENLHDDPATIRLRALIHDEFGAGDMDFPLQAEEYVLYKLSRRGVKIAWPPVRPRTPGTWHTILKDVQGVLIVPEPTAGCVMEFLIESEEGEDMGGHMAYVEAVFPDDSIQISEANWPDNGMYNERLMVLQEWQGLTPMFISFS